MNARITLQEYRARKLAPQPHERYRLLCPRCLQPELTCYCRHIQSFDSKLKFVILIHPLEVRRRIATGRMAHLVLEQSLLLQGHNFSQNPTLNALLKDPGFYPVILYPGRTSKNLSKMTVPERADLFPAGKEPLILVLDGTWSTAGKMLRHSQNLVGLPQIAFTPRRPSTFRVRQQPKQECFSTIEAIHEVVELLGPARGFDAAAGDHHGLLKVFDVMVEQQLEFIRQSRLTRPFSRHRRRPQA